MTRADKVYVACGGWDYEGFNDPDYAGASFADAAHSITKKEGSYHYWYIFEFQDGQKTDSFSLNTETQEWVSETVSLPRIGLARAVHLIKQHCGE